jgi:hypothetical protein
MDEDGHGHNDAATSWKASLPKDLKNIIGAAMFFTEKMDPNAQLITRLVYDVCKNCTILRSKILLVDEDGQPLGVDRGIYQHHVNMIPLSLRMDEPSFAAACPDTDKSYFMIGGYSRPEGMDAIGHVYGSQAVENFTLWFTPPDGSVKAGFYSDGGPIVMGSEIVNYNPTPRKVYVVVDMEYLPGKHFERAANMPLSVSGD